MNSSDVTDNTAWAAGIALGAAWLTLLALTYVWYAWALSITFRKLGTESWRAWVPVVNQAEIFRLGDHSPWKVLLYLVPVVNLYAIYVHIVSIHRLNVRFGYAAGTTVLGIVLPPVWATVLARGSVAAPVPLAQRIAAAAPTPLPDAPAASPESAILADVDDQTPPSAVPDAPEPRRASDPPPAAPRVHPGAPYAIRPTDAHDEPPPAAAPAAAQAPPAPMVAEPQPPSQEAAGRDPWSPVVSPPAPVEPVRPVPVEITAPPLAPVKDFALPPDAISALAASMIGRDDEEQPRVPATTVGGEEAEDGETVVVDRRPRIRWILTVDGAGDFRLTADRVLLGRKPTSSTSGTQALAIPDSTRTLSKLHARLDLDDGSWTITDLNSTNGVLLVSDTGAEELIDAGTSAPVKGRFILGKVGMSIRYEGESA